MKEKDYIFLPTAMNNSVDDRQTTTNGGGAEVIPNAPCPCCEHITIPNQGDALAYICPICFWEIDLFINSESEPSDQNNGLTLNQARERYKNFGAVMPHLKQECLVPKNWEATRENSLKD